MSQITNLQTLMASMSPSLDPRTFVFATVPEEHATSLAPHAQMTFREAEGLTLILEADQADAAGIEAVFPCRMITLQVHSALEAVGFLARILPALAEAGMGVNPVSAFFHDHLFVPSDRAEDAIEVLRGLVAAAQSADAT
ncbi:MAG: ACT domain-containing protein [Pseudomonadota bacterium]